MAGTTTVYTVFVDTSDRNNSGETDRVFRFRRQADALAFAAGKHHYGQPATVTREQVPPHVANRWSLA